MGLNRAGARDGRRALSDRSTELVFYRGDAVDRLTEVARNDGKDRFAFVVEAGATYRIVLADDAAVRAAFRFVDRPWDGPTMCGRGKRSSSAPLVYHRPANPIGCSSM